MSRNYRCTPPIYLLKPSTECCQIILIRGRQRRHLNPAKEPIAGVEQVLLHYFYRVHGLSPGLSQQVAQRCYLRVYYELCEAELWKTNEIRLAAELIDLWLMLSEPDLHELLDH